MRRFVFAIFMGAALALFAVAPAGAQYEQPPAERPLEPRAVANVTSAEVVPGESVTVSAPPAFAPGTPFTVNFVRANQGAAADQLGSGTTSRTGSASESVIIPETEPGVYFLYITGVDADGNTVVALVPMVVRDGGAASAAAVESGAFRTDPAPLNVTAANVTAANVTAANVTAAAVPTAVADVQTVTPDVEAAVVEAVTQQGAGVALSLDGTLQVRSTAGAVQDATTLSSTDADDIAQQVSIGAALLLAGSGLVLLRRRGGFTK